MPKYDVELVRTIYHVSDPFEVEATDEASAKQIALDMCESPKIDWDTEYHASQVIDLEIQSISLVEEPVDTAKEEGTRIERAIGDGSQS
jgi:hypothetical protein